ncbi:MAG TPA: ABC transporter ATP-binding protein [Candidatus Dormibacteraeota bacterium]|jgi:ABC-type nitrate/sulfonate/bicarbonate transport system ATPase subunit
MSAPATCIAVRDVSKIYERPGHRGEAFTALTNVSLDIAEGEFISLIGASGCGKTTLLRMISGLIPASTGEIAINGKRVDGVPDRIGFVFQEPALLPWRSVRDNLAFVLRRKGMSAEQVQAAIDDKLRLTNLQDFAGYYPQALSGGMQQRVGLARALVGDPDVLLMDEPLSALDAFTRRRLQEDIAGILGAIGTTTILVTHDVDEAVFFSDRIVVMGASPGSVREIVNVPLGRPRRHAEIVGNPEAAKVRDHVLSLVLDLH